MNRFLSNSRGLAMLKAVAVMGAIGAAGLLFTRMNQNQIIGQKRIENRLELRNLESRIIQALSNSESCKKNITLSSGVVSAPNTNLNSILGIDGEEVISLNKTYKGSIKIDSIKLGSPDFSTASSLGFGNLKLQVGFSIKGGNTNNKSSRKITKTYPLKIKLSTDSKLESCFYTKDFEQNGVVEDGVSAFCGSINGGLANGVCNLNSTYDVATKDGVSVFNHAISTKVLKEYLTLEIEGKLIPLSGGSIDGSLTLSSSEIVESNANPQICFTAPDSSGGVACQNFSSISCGTHVLVGLNQDGTAICETIANLLSEGINNLCKGKAFAIDEVTGALKCAGGNDEPTPVNGVCHETQVGKCLSGTSKDVPNVASFYKWECIGSGTGKSSECQVLKESCGEANGKDFTDAQSVNAAGLCTVGSSPAVSGSGPWLWNCRGVGSQGASCTANQVSTAFEKFTCKNGIAVADGVCFEKHPDCDGILHGDYSPLADGKSICCGPNSYPADEASAGENMHGTCQPMLEDGVICTTGSYEAAGSVRGGFTASDGRGAFYSCSNCKNAPDNSSVQNRISCGGTIYHRCGAVMLGCYQGNNDLPLSCGYSGNDNCQMR